MRKAGLVVWQAHQIAREMVRPGVTTGAIDAAIDEHIVNCGGIPLFKGVPGKIPFPAASCISVNDEVVHGIPGPRQLKEGDIVSIDIGVKFDGWCGDSAYTHPVGQVAPDVARLLDITKGALQVAIEKMATAKVWSEVAGEMERYVKDANFSVVECFVGHGIGRDMHEDPQVPNFVSGSLRRNGDFKLEPGLVIAVEPMVNMGGKRVKALADHWTQSTHDGRPSAHFEHTIAMTQNGPYVLTGPPDQPAP